MHGFHVFAGVIYLLVLWYQTQRGVYTQEAFTFGLTARYPVLDFRRRHLGRTFLLFYLW